jgi:class 3 adenylate cyclase
MTSADDIARTILHEQAARGERVVAWGRGVLWTGIGAILIVGLSGLELALGRRVTLGLGAGLALLGGLSFVYASRLSLTSWNRNLGLVTVIADVGLLSLLPIYLLTRNPLLVPVELLGASPNLLMMVFGLATVGLRHDPRAILVATLWTVSLCIAGAVYAALHGHAEQLAPAIRLGMRPELWCVRAMLMALTGLIIFVSARNARTMVHRTSTVTAERTHIMRVFGRFVAPEIRDAIVEGESPAELRQVTVLFTDLRDYTSLSEKIPPTELMALLNRHFSVLVPVVHRHGGTVNKFVGDALMATFGAPARLEAHAAAAVRAAVEMVAAMAALGAELRAEGRPELRIGVGVATGPVVVGNLGDPERAEYAVIGDTVNVAARLEGLNKERGTQILVNQATAEQAAGAVPLEELAPARVKGKEAELRIFTTRS